MRGEEREQVLVWRWAGPSIMSEIMNLLVIMIVLPLVLLVFAAAFYTAILAGTALAGALVAQSTLIVNLVAGLLPAHWTLARHANSYLRRELVEPVSEHRMCDAFYVSTSPLEAPFNLVRESAHWGQTRLVAFNTKFLIGTAGKHAPHWVMRELKTSFGWATDQCAMVDSLFERWTAALGFKHTFLPQPQQWIEMPRRYHNRTNVQ
jgi:hypothetical protein